MPLTPMKSEKSKHFFRQPNFFFEGHPIVRSAALTRSGRASGSSRADHWAAKAVKSGDALQSDTPTVW